MRKLSQPAGERVDRSPVHPGPKQISAKSNGTYRVHPAAKFVSAKPGERQRAWCVARNACAALGDASHAAARESVLFRLVLRALFAAVVLLAPGVARAQYAEVIAKVKPSVVAVGTFQRTRSPAFVFRGTGFAVGNGSLVVTNAHVLPATLAEDQFETLAVLLPGDERADNGRTAVRVAMSREHDLAVLRIAGTPLPPLKVGDGSKVREGDMFLITGYPLGNILGAYPVTHRGMISSIVPLAIPGASAAQLDPSVVRRLASGAFPIFQIDAAAYPGNSGSPLIDPATGEVMGVVNMVLARGTREAALMQPTSITYAVPAKYLRELLASVK